MVTDIELAQIRTSGGLMSEQLNLFELTTPKPRVAKRNPKPKVNRAANAGKSNSYDQCQTPAYALDPLLPHLDKAWSIWEPAAGEGLLADTLRQANLWVLASDILTGRNFFEWEPMVLWDAQITNPPYSLKFPWLERSYALGKPFALLLPVETIGAATAQKLFRKFGVEVIYMDKRINFKMPNKGWEGSSAQFPTAWFTWGLNIGKEMTFAEIERR